MPATSPPLPRDPLWYKDAVIYQLHVKSFYDSDGDGIGDFRGLIEKLDYIAELGVNAVWLLPFYPSPLRDDGYDIAEYRGVNPDYGDLRDLKHFIRAAHERGIRVITELVINHTSDQHPWFQKARHAKPGSAARNFYVWSDTDQRYTETRIIFLDTETSNWAWDPVAGAYYWHRFYSHQPDLNYDNPAVLRAILAVMRFWLDLGVDGLRLDAVPYLVERDGTSNENLPETHAVLKRIRAALDASYPDRMLLAEANQWPEDTQEYFGDGDECHMAFHFPLMPRMYMAIAKEDRFPISDILRQTPEIPESCQWAIFLRNHDELTLEMVTSSERDYLWDFYAADRRARINLGIRRRLAPLLERDRRRIELMNSLLLSMPGTPVIYYGDEIGMGDNVHLGDRDGVRTPMQWSRDRNGGFSRADPERLILPPIMDPLYGFEAVNVEAQARDPHSLLNWMRRMLALRRDNQAFGRGTLTFLYPGNRKILAYLRAHGDDRILCVANLSRAPQPVELDLSAHEGCVPIEMLGGSPFPPIGRHAYLMTLPPYGFFWFQLRAAGDRPLWYSEQPEALPEFVTLVLRRGIQDIAAGRPLELIEGEVLPAYLPKRRWFAAKDGIVRDIRLGCTTPLPGTDCLLGEVDVAMDTGGDRYLLPLGIAWEDQEHPPLVQQLALARVRHGRRVGLLTDAVTLDHLATGLVEGLRRGASAPAGDGELQFIPSPLLDSLEPSDLQPIHRLSSEQSNTSFAMGDKAMVKLVRRVKPGLHPEVEMSRHLTEQGYANAPPLLGEMRRVDGSGAPHTLAIVQGFVRNQGDAWAWTLNYLRRSAEDFALTGMDDGRGEDAFETYRNFAGQLGRRLGELHEVLARPSDDPSFAPEPADGNELAHWSAEARRQVTAAIDVLDARRQALDEALGRSAARLVERREDLLHALDRLARAGLGSLRTRIHGDFHLGQVLVVQSDVFLIDFEGEPNRPLAERRHKTSPLRDVAGLIRSLDYAAAAASDDSEATPKPIQDRRLEFLQRFRTEARGAFLDAYRSIAVQAPHPWVAADAEPALLDLFVLERAAYEIGYEAANRPEWIGIPLLGFAAVAERLLGLDRAP